MSLTGIRAGVPLIIAYTIISMWTIHLLNALYLEYKRTKVTRDPSAGGNPSKLAGCSTLHVGIVQDPE